MSEESRGCTVLIIVEELVIGSEDRSCDKVGCRCWGELRRGSAAGRGGKGVMMVMGQLLVKIRDEVMCE